jgi:fatty-acyl-CoA synthase
LIRAWRRSGCNGVQPGARRCIDLRAVATDSASSLRHSRGQKSTAREAADAMTMPSARLAARNDNAARGTTVGDVLIEWARQTPFRIAYADGGLLDGPPRSWTFEALRDDAATLAVALLSRYEPGERIALWAPPCAEGVLLQFAAALAGLVLVRIDPAWPARGMARILEISDAAGLFVLAETHGGRLSRAAEHAPSALRETVDLADRWALFAKHRCVDGLPEVAPGEPAEIRYPAPRSGAPSGETILHRDLANIVRPERLGDGSRSEREAAVA